MEDEELHTHYTHRHMHLSAAIHISEMQTNSHTYIRIH